ncbi:unnamed protein product [Somion occarium]|uniref:Uncharacterized protein n=1 Tax=Somion occarium TaxID=3059160 RepID=A0ABP1DGN0_9APHY
MSGPHTYFLLPPVHPHTLLLYYSILKFNLLSETFATSRSKPAKMDSDIKTIKRFRTFKRPRIIPAFAPYRFQLPRFFPLRNESRSDSVSVTSAISIELVSQTDTASTATPKHFREETLESYSPSTLDFLPLKPVFPIGCKIVDEPICFLYTELNMSSNDSQTASPTTSNSDQTPVDVQPGGLSPSPWHKADPSRLQRLPSTSNVQSDPKVDNRECMIAEDASRWPDQDPATSKNQFVF